MGARITSCSPRTNARFWDKKITANRSRDIDSASQATAAGWTVIRLWEHDVEGALNASVELVAKVVDASRVR